MTKGKLYSYSFCESIDDTEEVWKLTPIDQNWQLMHLRDTILILLTLLLYYEPTFVGYERGSMTINNYDIS